MSIIRGEIMCWSGWSRVSLRLRFPQLTCWCQGQLRSVNKQAARRGKISVHVAHHDGPGAQEPGEQTLLSQEIRRGDKMLHGRHRELGLFEVGLVGV